MDMNRMTSDLPTSGIDAVMNTLVDGAIVIDEYARMCLINPAGQAIFGYAPEDLIGHNVSMLMPDPYRSQHDTYLKRYLTSGEAHIIGIGRDVEGLRKDGEVFPMNLAVGEMSGQGRRLFVGIIRDLTEQRRREVEFDELQARHFHLSRVAAMNEMGAAIAHEINQPLSAAANYLETGRILASRAETKDDKLLSVLDKALEQNGRAAEIISRMRKFIERGDVRSETVDLRDIVDESLMLALSKFRDRPINVDRQIDPAAVFVRGDAVQIQQVLVNLLRNGCEAMADQGDQILTLSIALDTEHANMARISVSDKGEGLSDSVIADLFTAFASTKSDGLGVGLSISRSIVNAHGGRIWATDNQGPGATFSFTLPLNCPS